MTGVSGDKRFLDVPIDAAVDEIATAYLRDGGGYLAKRAASPAGAFAPRPPRPSEKAGAADVAAPAAGPVVAPPGEGADVASPAEPLPEPVLDPEPAAVVEPEPAAEPAPLARSEAVEVPPPRGGIGRWFRRRRK